MKNFLLLAAVILIAAQQSQSFMIMPSSLTMDKVQQHYFGFLEGVGAHHEGGVKATAQCFGPATALEAFKVLEEFKSLSFSSKIREMIPLFQNVVSLVSQLKQECDFGTLIRHISTHSNLQSLTHFFGNLYMRVDHLLSAVTRIQTYTMVGKYDLLGEAIGEFVGVLLNLEGVQQNP